MIGAILQNVDIMLLGSHCQKSHQMSSTPCCAHYKYISLLMTFKPLLLVSLPWLEWFQNPNSKKWKIQVVLKINPCLKLAT